MLQLYCFRKGIKGAENMFGYLNYNKKNQRRTEVEITTEKKNKTYILFIIGLDGSGKRKKALEFYQDLDWNIIDGLSSGFANIPVNHEYKTYYLVVDPFLLKVKDIHYILNRFSSYNLEFVLYENNPISCLANLLSRRTPYSLGKIRRQTEDYQLDGIKELLDTKNIKYTVLPVEGTEQ